MLYLGTALERWPSSTRIAAVAEISSPYARLLTYAEAPGACDASAGTTEDDVPYEPLQPRSQRHLHPSSLQYPP